MFSFNVNLHSLKVIWLLQKNVQDHIAETGEVSLQNVQVCKEIWEPQLKHEPDHEAGAASLANV